MEMLNSGILIDEETCQILGIDRETARLYASAMWAKKTGQNG